LPRGVVLYHQLVEGRRPARRLCQSYRGPGTGIYAGCADDRLLLRDHLRRGHAVATGLLGGAHYRVARRHLRDARIVLGDAPRLLALLSLAGRAEYRPGPHRTRSENRQHPTLPP